ncbi:hypothetical protein [Pandoravirus japonicus]|uniref:Uncharacterized protein n=1 Tax=Pandoravirus japonicus TaxID=2823154 RepID=A0A811BQY9_9VIRU|nr:hypothetical protein [Pandoravirus japonicus]
MPGTSRAHTAAGGLFPRFRDKRQLRDQSKRPPPRTGLKIKLGGARGTTSRQREQESAVDVNAQATAHGRRNQGHEAWGSAADRVCG